MFERVRSLYKAHAFNQESFKQTGSVLGAILLLSGSCIGVGMLALPVLTAFSGFIPTFVIFVFCWLLMTVTALLFLEAHLWSPTENSIFSLTGKILGKPGKILAWVNFLFLFYCLVVAYISKGGEYVQRALEQKTAIVWPSGAGSFLLTFVSFLPVYYGTRIVDRFNRICMLGLIAAFFYLLFFGLEHSKIELLLRYNWEYSLFIIPFIITSFGFHNMIPTIREYLNSDRKKIRKTIIFGGMIPFFIYILWIGKVQSIVPFEGNISLVTSFHQGEISSEPLALIVQSKWISLTAKYFAFFAIITSLLGQTLSIIDFLADSCKISKSPLGRLLLCSITFIPPLIFSYFFPDVFFVALELAGGVSAIILFAILPALIVWIGREKNVEHEPLVCGGRWTLSLVLFFSFFILGFELLKSFNFITFSFG